MGGSGLCRPNRTRIEKLGVKPGMRIALLGSFDDAVLAEIRALTEDVGVGRAKKESKMILLLADSVKELLRLTPLQSSITRDGAIWVIYRKGQREFGQSHVMAAAKQHGLVDIKIMSFSETHTGLKLVIPVAHR